MSNEQGGGGMTKMHRIIFILTGLLVLIGLIVLVSGNSLLPSFGGSPSYGTQSAYETSRGKGELPKNSPDLPACAEHVSVTKNGDDTVQSITFTCDDQKARDAYVAQIKNGFEWNIFLREGNKIEIDSVATTK